MKQGFDVIIVGSGASGAMAASSLVRKGLTVAVVDFGHDDESSRHRVPDRPYSWIRANDPTQADYFLGRELEGVPVGKTRVGAQLTPPRQFISRDTDQWLPYQSDSFTPMQTLALGGLGAGWGAACFTFSRRELKRIGIDDERFPRFYDEVSEEVGVSGDASAVSATHTLEGLSRLQPPLDIDLNAQALLRAYQGRKDYYSKRGLFLGKASLAVLSQDLGERKANPYFDMDFWGDSRRSVYRPRYTIEELRRRFTNFHYFGGILATSFESLPGGGIRVRGVDAQEREVAPLEARRLILAAGPLSSARIAANGLGLSDCTTPLLCSPYNYFPCLQIRRFGKGNLDRRHSLSQLSGVFAPGGDIDRLISMQFYSYRSLLLFKLVKEVPLPPWIGLQLMRLMVSSLLILGAFHRDERSTDRRMTIGRGSRSKLPAVTFDYALSLQEQNEIRESESSLMRLLKRLGCFPLGRIQPGAGSSIHYAGTIPSDPDYSGPLRCDSRGRLVGCQQVYIGDSSSWNFLPAKGLTFTLMANAKRIAESVSEDIAQQ